MNVRFAINLGTRDAQRLGVDHLECREGNSVDLPEAKIEEIRGICGPAAIVGIDKKSKASKAEPSEAELEKMTAPEPAKK